MARTSKKNNLSEEYSGHNTYSVGIYARLSVYMESKKTESIENQVSIAKSYIDSHPELVLHNCYIDEGATGTNFNRTGFESLMMDIRLGKVDCVLVKDFSRLGRDYIETGNYLQKIFPFMGVRFISITDNFDSINVSESDLAVNLKNLINELYVRDISLKSKSAKQAMWNNGSYTGGIAPYGYFVQHHDGKKQLCIEPKTSQVVQQIYNLYELKRCYKDVISWLYKNRIHRPSDYRKYGHVFCEENETLYQWTIASVRVLLSNASYMGCLVQARTCGMDYHLRNKSDIESDDFSVIQNAHEPIIKEEQFYRVGKIISENVKYTSAIKEVPHTPNIFANILYCGDCGIPMGRFGANKLFHSKHLIRRYCYLCRNSSRIDSMKCEKKGIMEEALLDIVKKAIKHEFSLFIGNNDSILLDYTNRIKKVKLCWIHELKDIDSKIKECRNKLSTHYISYRNEFMSQVDFIAKKAQIDGTISSLQKKQETCNNNIININATYETQLHFIQQLLKFDADSILDHEIVKTIIKRINIFADKRVQIIFNFIQSELIWEEK